MGIPYAEVIGDPIAHSKSPSIHKFWLEKLGLEGDYRAVRIAAGALPAYFASRRPDPDWRGCNLTMPLKTLAAGEVDRTTEEARRAAAINCVTIAGGRLIGTNTDIAGIAATLSPFQIYRQACIIGAGGAAGAAAAALGQRGIGDIRIVARSPDRARGALALAGVPLKFYSIGEAEQAMAGAEIIVNATPLGMAGKTAMPAKLLEALTGAHPDALVTEMVYSPLETPFLRRAEALGFGRFDGLDVLIGQARQAFRLFFGIGPRPGDDAELRRLLSA